ncbi:MAG: SDR family NAD(P)-dependent oxidoreductase [Halioglobus sp.]
MLEINLKEHFPVDQAVLDAMMAQRGGGIITIASVEGSNGTGRQQHAQHASRAGWSC